MKPHTDCPRCNFVGCASGGHSSPLRSFVTHFRFMLWLTIRRAKARAAAWVRSFSALDYSQIENVEVDGIDYADAPDFCDAFVASATYKGREMTQAELDRLNEDSQFVYEAVQNHLY